MYDVRTIRPNGRERVLGRCDYFSGISRYRAYFFGGVFCVLWQLAYLFFGAFHRFSNDDIGERLSKRGSRSVYFCHLAMESSDSQDLLAAGCFFRVCFFFYFVSFRE